MNAQAARSAGSSARTTVRQVMKPTKTIEQGAHLAAAEYLIEHSQDPTLVVTAALSQTPIGTVTETEISSALANGELLEDARVNEVDDTTELTVDADLPAADAARLMLARGIDRLPVVDGQQVIGVVELADVSASRDAPG